MFQCPSLIHSIKTLTEGGVALNIHTREVSPSEAAKLFELRGKEIWTAFKDTELEPKDISVPDVGKEFPNDKSPSKRLRDVLWVYWSQQLSGGGERFENFYERSVNKIIDQIKEKLN